MRDLEVVNLSKSYGGVRALRAVEFAADRGGVEGLLGENGAGKSTFIKILTGAVQADSGRVVLNGREVPLGHLRQARKLGIAAAFQELSVVPDLTVAENICFGREPRRWGCISRRRLIWQATQLLDRLALDGIDVRAKAATLPIAQRQLVEIARAFADDPEVLILDEATSALSAPERDWLLRLARRTAQEGKIVIFISHRLREVRSVADHVTVFRNGQSIARHRIDEIGDEALVVEMVGKSLTPRRERAPAPVAPEVALEIRGLHVAGAVKSLDLDVHKGEICGIGGVQGQGQAELFLALFGILRSSGTVKVFGQRVRLRHARAALAAGIALVPEERQTQGLLLPKSVRENVSLPILHDISRMGVIDRVEERRRVGSMMDSLRLVASDLEQPVETLSGGNQQKVVIGKALLAQPRILLMFDPVRGVDVATKTEVFDLMHDLAREGYAILLYSTDMQELVQNCDRVAVLDGGEVRSVVAGEDLQEENLLSISVGTS